MSEENRLTRPLVIIALSYIAGIVLGRFWVVEPAQALWAAGLLLLLALAAVLLKRLSFFMAVLLPVVAAAGAAAFVFASASAPGGVLEYADSPVYIEGTVVEEPLVYDDHSAYRLRVETVETRQGRFSVHGDLLVKIYGAERESYWFGERLRLRGVINEPKGARNPGGFDYRFYLRTQGIDGLVYPRPLQVSSLGQGDTGRLAASAAHLRGRMVEGISSNLPSPAAELLTAVLFGQRHRLPDEVEENFRRAGAGHLMAVSGLHVGLVAALILGLWRRFGLRGKLPLLLAIILVFGYVYLTGLRPSALRAAIMISLALGALLLDRDRDLPTAIALAALATLAYNPLLLFSVGFQLSYAATLAIVYLYAPLKAVANSFRLPSFIGALIAVTLAAQAGVLPLCAYHFHHVPLAALIFNLLLMPLIPAVIGLGLAGALAGLAAPFAAMPFFLACRPLLELMLAVTGAARLPGIYVAVYPPGLPALALFYGAVAAGLALYYRQRSRGHSPEKHPLPVTAGSQAPASPQENPPPQMPRSFPLWIALLLAAAVILLWYPIARPSPSHLAVTFLDVGQGAAALVEAPCGAVIMIDSGGDPPYRGDPGSIGERTLLPFLRHEGIRRIDMVVVSHPHEDHFGGFLPLVEAFPIGRMLISPVPGESPHYQELLERSAAAGIPVEETAAGETWSCGCSCLLIEVLAPPPVLLRGTGSDLNNNSIVMRLHYGDIRILFCGDAEDTAVRDLFSRQVDLRADILLVPHHGGYLAAIGQFLQAVNPQIAVIPVGVNPFGHPHPAVLAALEEAAVPVFRTDLHGAVIVITDGASIQVKPMIKKEKIDAGLSAILSN